jgi:hypothetical protein
VVHVVSDAPKRMSFGVRSVALHEQTFYEERIVLVSAVSLSDALAVAEREAREYALVLNASYIDFFQAYGPVEIDPPLGDPVEVFSLVRESSLRVDAYLARFFVTGAEISGGRRG